MKGDCETYQGSRGTGVEYYSMCITLAPGSLNDVVGNIKSSIGLRALIWIVKAVLAVNRTQQRKMDITHYGGLLNLLMNIWSGKKLHPCEGVSADIGKLTPAANFHFYHYVNQTLVCSGVIQYHVIIIVIGFLYVLHWSRYAGKQ